MNLFRYFAFHFVSLQWEIQRKFKTNPQTWMVELYLLCGYSLILSFDFKNTCDRAKVSTFQKSVSLKSAFPRTPRRLTRLRKVKNKRFHYFRLEVSLHRKRAIKIKNVESSVASGARGDGRGPECNRFVTEAAANRPVGQQCLISFKWIGKSDR